MYRCQRCNKLSSPREKQNNLVVETRSMTYTNIVEVNEKKKELKTQGYETVREIKVCNTCMGAAL